MRDAVSERLQDLVHVAQRLQVLIDSERPDALLPSAELCRLARVVDATTGELQRFVNALGGGPCSPQDAFSDAMMADPALRRRQPF